VTRSRALLVSLHSALALLCLLSTGGFHELLHGGVASDPCPPSGYDRLHDGECEHSRDHDDQADHVCSFCAIPRVLAANDDARQVAIDVVKRRALGEAVARQQRWRHCFSMASSAIRRSVWEERPFDESLGYSEDIDWTWRARQSGREIRYVPDSVVLHSHDYTLRQLWRRHHGEGRAEARIFDWEPWERSLLRYSLLPWARQVASDIAYCARAGDWGSVIRSPIVRASATLGRRSGFVRGLGERAREKSEERSPENVC